MLDNLECSSDRYQMIYSFLPAYSICIPNYNHAHYLRTKIPQCLAQTYQPSEILIIDDGSTDDSCAVVKEFAKDHPHIRLVAHPHNRGINETITTALQSAQSDFVALSSADDHLLPAFGEKLMAILAHHPTTGFAFSDPAERIENTGKICEVPLALAKQASYFSPEQFCDLLAHNYFSLPSHASIYRKDALLAMQGFNTRLEWYGDWVAGYALAFTHGVCYVPETLALFTIRDDSISGIGRINKAKQENLTRIFLRCLQSLPYSNVRSYFRQSALLTEYRFRSLRAVWRTDISYLTWRLFFRIMLRELWHHSMPYVPLAWRRALRRIASKIHASSS